MVICAGIITKNRRACDSRLQVSDILIGSVGKPSVYKFIYKFIYINRTFRLVLSAQELCRLVW